MTKHNNVDKKSIATPCNYNNNNDMWPLWVFVLARRTRVYVDVSWIYPECLFDGIWSFSRCIFSH